MISLSCDLFSQFKLQKTHEIVISYSRLTMGVIVIKSYMGHKNEKACGYYQLGNWLFRL